jgi:hypothetical protein
MDADPPPSQHIKSPMRRPGCGQALKPLDSFFDLATTHCSLVKEQAGFTSRRQVRFAWLTLR